MPTDRGTHRMHIFLQTHTHTHAVRGVRPPDMVHVSPCLIRFPWGKLVSGVVMGFNLTDLQLSSLFLSPSLCLFFSTPTLPHPTHGCLVYWLGEGLVGCWQAAAHRWQNEGLPRWLTRDTHWLTEWQLASYSVREINELFLWLCKPGKSTNPSSAGTLASAKAKPICGHVVCLDTQFSVSITFLEDEMTRKCDLTL